ncbi:hypothetical protein ABS735_38530 [Streptomyces sp. MMCC 100]|uniref:hypothetical protein n=1 Tax=Streptomyces sp. MMCC 100 TaxID=3163555 RepID=UPI0035961205
MWRRRKRPRHPEVSPVTLCDLCAMVVPVDEAVRAYVPDSSAVHRHRHWFDGLRLLTACGEPHLERLRKEYRRRPFVQEELWAAKIGQVLTDGAPTLTLVQLACRTGLHESEIRRAVAWHNWRRREAGEEQREP